MQQFLRCARAELEAAEREMGDVRAILADAVERLLADAHRRDPGGPGREALTALQFQDICDQLLAHASGRVATVVTQMREAGEGGAAAFATSRARPVHMSDLEPGATELF